MQKAKGINEKNEKNIECLRFSEAVMDKPLSFHAFELLYWTGIRCGKLLALMPSDFMLESSRLRINKSYQSLHGVDTVTDPKTPKSVRMIVMPAFLRGGEAFCERSESTEGLDGGLAKEVRLAAPYGELNESLQQRIELVMRFFLALGGPVDALSIDKSMKSSMAVSETLDMDTDGDTSIFDMGRG